MRWMNVPKPVTQTIKYFYLFQKVFRLFVAWLQPEILTLCFWMNGLDLFQLERFRLQTNSDFPYQFYLLTN